MELIVVLLVVGMIVALLLGRHRRASKRANSKALLDRAWRIVLSDPNYEHRRNYEERMREDEARIRKSEGLK